MTNDLIRYAQSGSTDSPGVGEAPGDDLLSMVQVSPGAPTGPYKRKMRSRPNRGRKKRTDRHPLAEPPWDMLRALDIPLPPQIQCLRYTPVNWRAGPRVILWRVQVYERYGRTCHLCKHGGADSVDHLIPLSVWSNQPYEPMLARPAHGVAGCPICHIPCNSSRGNRQLATQIGNYKPPVAL